MKDRTLKVYLPELRKERRGYTKTFFEELYKASQGGKVAVKEQAFKKRLVQKLPHENGKDIAAAMVANAIRMKQVRVLKTQ